MNPKTEILKSEDCFATVALTIFLQENGWDAINWLPETVVRTIEKAHKDVPLTTINKLQAGLFLINPATSDDFYQKLDRFVLICNCLMDGTTEDTIAEPLEICWGITEAQLIAPHAIPKKSLDLLSSDVDMYIRLCMKEAGIIKTPATLQLVGIDENLSEEILQDFADDPALYEAVYENIAEKGDILDTEVLFRLDRLVLQLLQLQYPVTTDQVKRTLYQPEEVEKEQ